MGKIVVFGNSVFAENIYFHLTYNSLYEVVAFTVDRAYIKADKLFDLPVVPFDTVESFFPPSQYKMTVAISYQKVNTLREEKYIQAKAKGYELLNYISPRCTLYPNLTLGDNCIVLDNCIMGPFVRLGNNVIITDGAIIGHHAVLKDHCFIGSGAVILGGATLEERCVIGANATIKEEVIVARECIVGINASITRNTREKGVYTGSRTEMHPKRSDQVSKLLTWPVRQHPCSTGAVSLTDNKKAVHDSEPAAGTGRQDKRSDTGRLEQQD